MLCYVNILKYFWVIKVGNMRDLGVNGNYIMFDNWLNFCIWIWDVWFEIIVICKLIIVLVNFK